MDTYLFDDAITVQLPDQYEQMTAEEQRQHYSDNLPNYVFIYRKKEAYISAIQTDETLENEDVTDRLRLFQAQIERLTPGFVMGEMLAAKVQERNYALFTFKSNALTKDLYTIIVLTTFQRKELLFMFRCDLQDAFTLSTPFMRMIESIKFQEVEAND